MHRTRRSFPSKEKSILRVDQACDFLSSSRILASECSQTYTLSCLHTSGPSSVFRHVQQSNINKHHRIACGTSESNRRMMEFPSALCRGGGPSPAHPYSNATQFSRNSLLNLKEVIWPSDESGAALKTERSGVHEYECYSASSRRQAIH